VLYLWQEDRLGRRQIRAECDRCHRHLTFPPLAEPYISRANAAASATPILEALTRLDALGVELASDGHSVRFAGDGWRRVPPQLQALVRQCNHDLARMLGDNRRALRLT
jgi:hypothetical protein